MESERKEKAGTVWCPISREGKACRDNCAWSMDGLCAVQVIARQMYRQGTEQFFIAEMMRAGLSGKARKIIEKKAVSEPEGKPEAD